jgi:predicted nucleic acid-binding protein
MIVVADSGPLHYLILLDEIDLLRRLYGDVRIPAAVVRELSAAHAPHRVAEWIAHPPSWTRVEQQVERERGAFEGHLDTGEREAIALAAALLADFVLLDDRAARCEAQRLNIRVTGTLGILRVAAERGFIDVPQVLNRLRTTNFYFDEDLLVAIFGRWLTA